MNSKFTMVTSLFCGLSLAYNVHLHDEFKKGDRLPHKVLQIGETKTWLQTSDIHNVNVAGEFLSLGVIAVTRTGETSYKILTNNLRSCEIHNAGLAMTEDNEMTIDNKTFEAMDNCFIDGKEISL